MSDRQQHELRLAVIGGGISGLTAAYRLTKLLPRARVELFEASDQLGGVLQTRTVDSWHLEQGADSFLNKIPAALELCQELGIDQELVPTNSENRRAFVVRKQQLYSVPEGFVVIRPHSFRKMLASPLISWRGKLRALLEPWIPPHPDINDPEHDESVAEFATRRLGKECFEYLVQPLLAGIYTADPQRLSVAATMPDAIEDERLYGGLYRGAIRRAYDKDEASSGARYGRFLSFRQGIGRLTKALSEALPAEACHTGQSVQGIVRSEDSNWLLTTSAGSQEFAGVVVALPAPRAAVVLGEVDKSLSDELGGIPYASSAVVSLVYAKQQLAMMPAGFGIVVPSVEGRPIVAVSFTSTKFPDRVSPDQVLVRVFLGGALAAEQMSLSDDQLRETAESELSELIGASGPPLGSDVARWPEKMPQYHVGHLQLVDRIDRRVAKLDGLELAGNAYRGVGIPQCIHSGNEAARRLATYLDP